MTRIQTPNTGHDAIGQLSELGAGRRRGASGRESAASGDNSPQVRRRARVAHDGLRFVSEEHRFKLNAIVKGEKKENLPG